MIHTTLELGNLYSKKDLAPILNEKNLAIVREGIYYCKNTPDALFFVDLEKQGKEERFRFDDYFVGEIFHWDSQTTQHINSPKIQEIVQGERTPHLFARIVPKIKGKTQPFVYCGRLNYLKHDSKTSKPVHMVFQSVDYDDTTDSEALQEIYLWKPENKGYQTNYEDRAELSMVSERRKRNYTKPNKTERQGLVTSRVGQGYYRQQILEKWGAKCPLTGCDIKSILISSHIVPWRECHDDDRLAVENGILLSPNADALFDRHLISFDEEGKLIWASKINEEQLYELGINAQSKIKVSAGMENYLKIHREKTRNL